MSKLNISFAGQYRNTKGNTVFRYTVSGSNAELAKYKEVQGDFHRVDDETGKPIYFNTKFVGAKGVIVLTRDGKRYVADMSTFDQAHSLSKQYGGNFGQELAKAAAAQLLGGTPSATAPAEQPKVEEPSEEQDN